MFTRTHVWPGCVVRVARSRRSRLLLAWLLLGPSLSQAQVPPGTVGSITGDDLSVEKSSSVLSPTDPRSILLISGSVATVHSGIANMTLAGGGWIRICGPARFTLLASGGAVTLALEFGRIHLQLEAGRPFAVYTPLTVATPLAISEGPRDVTLALETTGALCVMATRGAVRLEEQLSGQTLIVPQPSELFLSGGQFNQVPGQPGSCRCDSLDVRAEPPRPLAAPETSPLVAMSPAAAGNPSPPSSSAENEPAPPSKGLSMPAGANDARPSTPLRRDAPPAPPVPEQAIWKAIMPPLTFNVGSPVPPPAPSTRTILLIREVQVEPDWVFRGRVVQRTAASLQSAGASSADLGTPSRKERATSKTGFWAWVRRFFTGRS